MPRADPRHSVGEVGIYICPVVVSEEGKRLEAGRSFGSWSKETELGMIRS